MKMHHKKPELHTEPPAVLLTDMAFNLLIFFVVCASTEPSDGRRQDIPGSSQTATAQQQQSNHIEVQLTRATTSLNGDPIGLNEFPAKLKQLLQGKTRIDDRIVLIKSSRDTPYEQWIRITGWIDAAGGITTLQMEEEQAVQVE